MAQPKNALPKSGLPGLVYRRRGNVGSWIVVVFVPTHLRSLLVNSKGKDFLITMAKAFSVVGFTRASPSSICQ